jgi:hypothetical protein
MTEKSERTTWGFLLCWLKNISSSSYRYQLRFGLNEQSSATEYNINCINFTQQRFGLKLTRNISTAESPERWAAFY